MCESLQTKEHDTTFKFLYEGKEDILFLIRMQS